MVRWKKQANIEIFSESSWANCVAASWTALWINLAPGLKMECAISRSVSRVRLLFEVGILWMQGSGFVMVDLESRIEEAHG